MPDRINESVLFTFNIFVNGEQTSCSLKEGREDFCLIHFDFPHNMQRGGVQRG